MNKRVVVVTGGAGLLGKEICRAIASNGDVAIIADVNLSAAERVAQEISNIGAGAVHAEWLDICDKSSIDDLIDRLQRYHGGVYAVINNAYPRNKNYGRRLEDIDYIDFCENLNRHLGGYFLVSQRFSQYFKKNNKGVIINMGSIYGVIAPRFNLYSETEMTMPLEYAAIKAAVIHMTRYFAQYYKREGIRCNCISPGGISDNQSFVFQSRYKECSGTKGMLSGVDITGCVLFLLSEESLYINGQNIVIDDGFSL